ncbi:hypothetical protein SAMN05216386_1285 [Nitrosospira briensis]|uniref:Uncharacterized protein n=1 Tax=Nitrosospira briensis TaxID=35799 RepID=A0A1I5AAE1_9PROT|nr:hypothetical protein SAMN05216386_1285 [Nitrosospira briensis]
MWVTRDQVTRLIKLKPVDLFRIILGHNGLIVTVLFFFIPRMFESFRNHYSMNSELTESSLLILSIVSASRLATLSC